MSKEIKIKNRIYKVNDNNETMIGVHLPVNFVHSLWEYLDERNKNNPIHKLSLKEFVYEALVKKLQK